MFTGFNGKNLLFPKQSEFRPRNFCVNLFLSVKHAVFRRTGYIVLNIPKAFHKAKPNGSIYDFR